MLATSCHTLSLHAALPISARAQTLALQVLEATAAELQPAELERAKAQAKAGLLMGLESVQARCDHLARQLMIYRTPVAAADIVAEHDRCDLDRARRVASRHLAGPLAAAPVGHTIAT